MKQYKTYREKSTIYGDEIVEEIAKHHVSTITLDDNDRIIASLNYDEEGNLIYSYKSEYDDNGNLIFEERNDDELGTETRELIYEDGLLVEENITTAESGKERIVREYNENGNIAVQTSYDDDGEVMEKVIYTYEDGDLAKIEYDYDGEIMPYQQFYYDDNKNVIKVTETNLDEKKLDTINEYDDKNRLIKKVSYNEYKGVDSTDTYEYDDNGRVVYNARSSKGNSFIFRYSYLEDNILLKQDITYADGSPFMLIENTYVGRQLHETKTIIYSAETGSKDIEILTREY